MRVATAFCVTALLAAVVLAGTVVGTGAVAAQDGPTVRVTDASLDPGGTTTMRIVLTSAPDGLAGYELVLSVSDGDVAAITGANYTDAFGLTTEPVVSDDGRTLRLEAADVGGNVEAGATDVTLATVELRGESAGRAGLEVRPVQFDADGGAVMNVSVASGSVVVGEPEPTATSTGESGATDGSASSSDADVATATPTNTTTSGQGGLPLAGLGVAAVALALVGVLLGRRR
ncbi:MAG: cell surface protein [Haloarculaceae archaeon]